MASPLPEIEDCPVAGGCDRCEATQTLTADRVHVDILWLRVRHAAGCPSVARVRAAKNN